MTDMNRPIQKVYAVRRGTLSTAKRAELRLDYDRYDLFSEKPAFHGRFNDGLSAAQRLAGEEAFDEGGKVETWVVIRGPSSTMLTIYEVIPIEIAIASPQEDAGAEDITEDGAGAPGILSAEEVAWP
jgi:hypothetical protein